MPPTILWQAVLLYLSIREEMNFTLRRKTELMEDRAYYRKKYSLMTERQARAKVIKKYFDCRSPMEDSWIEKRVRALATFGMRYCLNN